MTIKLTGSQAKALCNILHKADTFDFNRGKGNYEIKEYTVRGYDSFVSVILEVGMVGDEGTLAQVYARDRVHLFIGKRGGITYPSSDENGKWCAKPLAKTSLLGVAIEQRH